MTPTISCIKDGKIHATLEVPDIDATGYSSIAFHAGWLQTNTVSGRGYCCPECHAAAWEGQEDLMGR